MSIKEESNKINPLDDPQNKANYEEEVFDLEPKDRGDDVKKHLFLGVLIILVALGSFGLGRLSFYKDQKTAPEVLFFDNSSASAVLSLDELNSSEIQKTIKNEIESQENGIVVGSKNSDKYHYPWCSGAKRIAEENKITFASIEEARKAGYVPASNCKGLK